MVVGGRSGRRGVVAHALVAVVAVCTAGCASDGGARQVSGSDGVPVTAGDSTSLVATTGPSPTVVESTTTSSMAAPATTAPATTEAPAPTTTVELAELAIAPVTLASSDIGQRYTAFTYIRAGADPVINPDGTVTFTIKRPMVQKNGTEYPAGVVERIGQPSKTILDFVITRITEDRPEDFVIVIDAGSPIVFFGESQQSMEQLAADPALMNDEYYASWATYWGDGTDYAGVAACGTETFVEDDVVYTTRVVAEFQVSRAPDGQWYVVQDAVPVLEGYTADERPAVELECFDR